MRVIDLENIIKSKGGILFGSRAWGGSLAASDYDFVMPLADAEDTKQQCILSAETVVDNRYYVSGFYVHCEDGVVNVTGCKRSDFKAWYTATEMMKVSCAGGMCKDDRQMLFETILSILKKVGV